ncbi:MAG: FIST C-terminal domain-containing protein, partial [Sandaracinaceae bacterium]
RMVGLEVDKLTPLIFATYPVVVRVGGSYYVRSIQKVNEDESLTFFCAIDEGIVLTVARGVDLVDNLKETFESVRARIGTPELVLGCDCILRSLELDQRGIKQEVAEIMRANNVVGFSTYGEQFNSMHVNQTFTGVAIG